MERGSLHLEGVARLIEHKFMGPLTHPWQLRFDIPDLTGGLGTASPGPPLFARMHRQQNKTLGSTFTDSNACGVTESPFLAAGAHCVGTCTDSKQTTHLGPMSCGLLASMVLKQHMYAG